jgi:hypothetical protein
VCVCVARVSRVCVGVDEMTGRFSRLFLKNVHEHFSNPVEKSGSEDFTLSSPTF